MRVESYVLPSGAARPSLEQLQSPGGMDRLRSLARALEPQAPLAAETVGPAASYAPLSRRASATAPLPSARSAAAAAAPAVAYPEPSRTMTLDESRKGLGSDKKFYVKSRFAVCTGASFTQTWFRNNRPAGLSWFNVRVVGTVAKNSREIKYQYHFSEMGKDGTPPTSRLKVTTKGAIPQSWPSTVRYTQGGNMPGTKTFDQLKQLKTFTHTVNAKPGQGSSGSSDLVFSVYEPTIALTPPAGYTLGGAQGGKLFMLAPRWDTAKYLANSTGGGNPARKGAATFSYVTALPYSARQGAPEREVAQHIKTAFTKPEDTKPVMAAKKVPGQVAKEPLHRLVAAGRKDNNRKAAVKQCKRYWGDNYSQGGARQCDEYPFATTYEGAAQPDYDAEAKKFNFSAKPVGKDPNRDAGILLNGFYGKNRIIDGLDDGFLVKITS
ncbi:hypothetical protein [Streptomyces sp. MZ04]|uniref:NucA/NucB deoxyribonuclease domain-containing protein n=1 Tax=Streptomyces sp. MZ04 TaxID=2559236 RepID=UPI001FD7F8C5|nr:hypothetical protein [Streptomyces sp. MZ04]